jgi:hypothetical protein
MLIRPTPCLPSWILFGVLLSCGSAAAQPKAGDQEPEQLFKEEFLDPKMPGWNKDANLKNLDVVIGKANLQADKWGFLRRKIEKATFAINLTMTIAEPARDFHFFGENWSVWPDPTFGDGGYEAGILCRGGKDSGYRVQFSSRYQEVSLVKYPDGGYVCSAPCPVKVKQPHQVKVEASGNWVEVVFDGKKVMSYWDREPLKAGDFGIGVSSGARVEFSNLKARIPIKHFGRPVMKPAFSVRKWLGGRQWIFDGQEPILLLPNTSEPVINNVKLTPGYKPQMSWSTNWDIANQGVYKDGENRSTEPVVSAGGKSISANWTARQVKDRFATRTKLTIGMDEERWV